MRIFDLKFQKEEIKKHYWIYHKGMQNIIRLEKEKQTVLKKSKNKRRKNT